MTKSFIAVWLVILGIHLVVLLGIGQIAFTKQYFNDADNMLGEFLEIKGEVKQEDYLDEETALLINSLIEQASNNAGDLQELASQSFNIILGALLAFLSASSTIIFQELQKKHTEPHPQLPDGTDAPAAPDTKQEAENDTEIRADAEAK